MKEKLLAALDPLGYPVLLQGSLLDDEPYPNEFITFWTADSSSAAEFDNESAETAWTYQIINYCTSPARVAEIAQQIRAALKAAGFISQGKGRDIPSDTPTHTGWACDFIYIENEGVI